MPTALYWLKQLPYYNFASTRLISETNFRLQFNVPSSISEKLYLTLQSAGNMRDLLKRRWFFKQFVRVQ